MRAITKQAQKLPADLTDKVNNFLQFIRRNNIVLDGGKLPAGEIVRRFELSAMINLDETPIPFQYAEGRTYNIKGAKTIPIKLIRSGYQNRQATVVLAIDGSGGKLKPGVIFHGETGGSIDTKERSNWKNIDVRVHVNKKAWNNSELMKNWVEQDLRNIMTEKGFNSLFVVIDSAAFHLTKEVRMAMTNLNIILCVVPAGCTSAVQPLDTHINKAFKNLMKQKTEQLLYSRNSETVELHELRLITLQAVEWAWAQIPADLIEKSFIQCGITIHPDGSEDESVRIKQHTNPSWEGFMEAKDTQKVIQEQVAQLITDEEFATIDQATLAGELQFLLYDDTDKKETDHYQNMKKGALLCLVKARKIPGYSRLKKAELVTLLLKNDIINRQQNQTREPLQDITNVQTPANPLVNRPYANLTEQERFDIDMSNIYSFESQGDETYYSQPLHSERVYQSANNYYSDFTLS